MGGKKWKNFCVKLGNASSKLGFKILFEFRCKIIRCEFKYFEVGVILNALAKNNFSP